MSRSNSGGAAFPTGHPAQAGMTLRDYFAAKAIPVIAEMNQNNMTEGRYAWLRDLASDAYDLTDAMIAERDKGGAK